MSSPKTRYTAHIGLFSHRLEKEKNNKNNEKSVNGRIFSCCCDSEPFFSHFAMIE